MIETIVALDKELFLFLNGLNAEWLDPIMFWISGKKEWIPFYIIIIAFLIKQYKWKTVLILAGIGLSITLADQITSGFMKPFFERPRPSHEPTLQGLVHIINNYKGGAYGFASSHAANTFAVAMFLWLLLKNNHRWVVFMFGWAAIVSYSRIYLGVHYPGDILIGGLIGAGSAWIMFRLYSRADRNYYTPWIAKRTIQ